MTSARSDTADQGLGEVVDDLHDDELTFDNIAPMDGPPPEGSEPADRQPVLLGKPHRRDVLRGLGLAGMALAMQVVGVIPLKKAWAANRYGYRLVNYPDGRCYDYNCVPGCGPSKVCGTTNYQAYGHCCRRWVDTPDIKPNGYWHRNGDRVGDDGNVRRYRLRPGACYGADAWIWRVTGCGTAYDGCGVNATTTMRCHDGWYKLNGSNNTPSVSNGWTKTICKHRYACG
jgi:hypothetical protein